MAKSFDASNLPSLPFTNSATHLGKGLINPLVKQVPQQLPKLTLLDNSVNKIRPGILPSSGGNTQHALPSLFNEIHTSIPVQKPKGRKKTNFSEEEEVPTESHYVLRSRSERKIPTLSIEEEEDSDYDLEFEKKKKKENVFENGIIDNPSASKVFEKILAIKQEDGKQLICVKWKGLSYLHIEWISEEQFLLIGGNVSGNKQKIKRFLQKKNNDEEKDIFPIENTEIERIISANTERTRYLVKWQKLPYTECTWENVNDISDKEKINEFEKRSKCSIVAPLPKRVWQKKVESPNYKHGNTLRSYQLEGHNWLVFNWCRGKGCILADEMGLGKTVQVVSFLEHLYSFQKLQGPFLIVVPLSMIEHWHREILEWTDMNVVIYHGSKGNRQLVKYYEWYYKDFQGKLIPGHLKFHVLLTTYEIVISDWEDLSKISWLVTVVDEAHRLKNKDSKLLKALCNIQTNHKVLLTGTPIQNNLGELWTLLNYIEPKTFPSLEEFDHEFNSLDKSAEQVNKLQESIKPFFLRRMKNEVEKSIPPKEETIIEVELTMVQKQYYRALYEKNREFLNKGCVGSNVPNLQNLMMQLRKVCNHPYLIPGVEEKDTAQFPEGSPDYFNQLIRSSGKLVLLDKLLPKLYADHHKVLIFSQLKKVLNIIEKYLKYKGYFYERLDGSIKSEDRQNAIDRFMNPEMNRFIFLLCTRAGGFGINLSEADTVIIFDSDWNPQNDLQAQARCHRIGQKKEVKVYRLVSKNTYERYMFERASMKLGLDQAVLANITTSSDPKDKQQPSKELIESLLRNGAYGAFKDDEESSSKFCEEDIEQILEKRSSKVVWKGGENSLGGSFSTATFQSETGETIDVNDEHFWEKVLPKDRNVSQLTKIFNDVFGGRAGRTSQARRNSWILNEKEQYLKDVNDFAKQIIEEYESKGKISPDRDGLVSLIETILTVKSYFEEDEVNTLEEELEQLKVTRHRRTTLSRMVSTDIEMDEDENEESLTKKKKVKKEELSIETKINWYNSVINYGRVNWMILRDRARINEDCQQDELRILTIRFLKNCIAACDINGIEKKYFVKLLLAFHDVKRKRRGKDEEINDEHHYTLEPEYSFITNDVKSWAVKLKYINRLCSLFIHTDTVIGALVDIPNQNCNFPELKKWWNDECNKDLVIGVYKYGFSSSEYLQQDQKLCFVELMKDDDDEDKLEKESDEPGDNKIVIKIPKEFPSNKDLDKQAKTIIAWLDKFIKKQKKEHAYDEEQE
ncbi:hypothetical protein ENUP19_0013G0034 [Entamoeba nuttalli]